MRRRISLLVAATTSAVVLAFLLPLALLVRTMAADRAMANAADEARNIALLVSTLHADPGLAGLVAEVDQRSPARTSVLTADGTVLGAHVRGLAADPEVARARAGSAFTVHHAEGAEILVPVLTAGGTDVVHTTVPAAELRRGVSRAWFELAGLGVLLLAAAVLVADRLGRRVSVPVTDLAVVAHRLREGDLGARAEPAGPPETVELGEALNGLAERVVELLATERAAVGDLSHRLRTPVTALRLDAEAVHDPEVAERLQDHIVALQRAIDAVVKDARRPVSGDLSTTADARETVRDRVRFWSALAEDQDRRLDVDLPAQPVMVPLGAAQLRDLVDILVDNVFAHTPEGTAFEIALSVRGDDARLVVADRGPGFAPYSAGGTGSTGLGLQIVRRSVTAVGGHLQIDTSPDRGTRVEVRLPTSAHGQSSSSSR